ncbi:polysaccharide biosynthesis/export family protein [Candidatus Laterigemmans baculatus]|uniref:polysaccharide biosynthesis/export family protein n=1 Tax=Candidatus Laterigemmans baculatus TaxID=2770505 RepID=UPI00193B6221|nr:polysaccharide biosynthesis/export family protein [Candidatus Laterigemmans baculatus]
MRSSWLLVAAAVALAWCPQTTTAQQAQLGVPQLSRAVPVSHVLPAAAAVGNATPAPQSPEDFESIAPPAAVPPAPLHAAPFPAAPFPAAILPAAELPHGTCGNGCSPCLQGVDCAWSAGAEGRWEDMRPMDFQQFGPGEYAGPPRLSHLAEYRLRPGDQLQLIYLLTRRQINGSYRLMVGDEVLIESVADEELTRGTFENGLRIQPDGTITVRLLGQVHAAGLTITQLRELLEERYTRFYPEPAVDVTPIRTNTLAEDIRNAVGGASGLTQQAITVTVTPDGTIRLPVIGSVRVQGLSLDEVKREINLAYNERVVGIEVEPILTEQAPHYVYVIGEVGVPSRIELDGPTTVTAGIASAGGWLPGANLRQVVIFRRAEDWRIVSTMLDLRGALLGKRPTPSDEIWLRDGDVVVVPPAPIRLFDNFVRQVFTEGVYGIVPFGGVSISLGDE